MDSLTGKFSIIQCTMFQRMNKKTFFLRHDHLQFIYNIDNVNRIYYMYMDAINRIRKLSTKHFIPSIDYLEYSIDKTLPNYLNA